VARFPPSLQLLPIGNIAMAEEGRRLIASTGPSVTIPAGKIAPPFTLSPSPAFLQTRSQLFDQLLARQQAELQAKPKEPITIVLPDSHEKTGVSWQTTPFDIAKQISSKLAKEAVVAKIRYTRKVGEAEVLVDADAEEEGEKGQSEGFELWDLTRPLEGDCQIQILTIADPEAKVAFWHSSAHILGASLEKLYGAHLCIGPPVNPGFYYDCYLGEEHLSQDNFEAIENSATELVGQKAPFQRVVLTKAEALELFSYNPFKTQLIQYKVAEGEKTTAYRCGHLIDLCKGPHLPNTGLVKAFAVTKNSSCYWLGKAENDSLQRIYGVSFPDKAELEEYLENQRKIAARDHHNIGRDQDLFFWHPHSAGSTFFLPAGARIYNRLMDFTRRQYRCRGFTEVISPNMFNCDLWKTSGHYAKYKDDMFIFNVENAEWGLKPMNCPGHCLMFDHVQRSYKELPLRFADFGVLHRNEASGALSGLTRVRRFQQDDAHIFCRRDQITQEVLGSLDFLSYIYGVFGFEYELELSTRPANALGGVDLWTSAEEQLASALNQFGKPWKVNPGDGAFYGPKIDIKVYDAMKRRHQCGTVQLDFNLPKRFNLQYKTEDYGSEVKISEEELVQYEDFKEKQCKPGFERPVIIHRAILGSMERMMAVLAEHFGGKWPFWLSPRQAIIIPVSEKFISYAETVKTTLELAGYFVEVDRSSLTLNKKIRNAQVSQYNYIGVVGKDEVAAGSVDVRDRDENKSLGKFSVFDFIDFLKRQEPAISQAESTLRSQAIHDVIEVSYKIDLKDLNTRLAQATFLSGATEGEEDWRIFKCLSQAPDRERLPHVHRWYVHLQSIQA